MHICTSFYYTEKTLPGSSTYPRCETAQRWILAIEIGPLHLFSGNFDPGHGASVAKGRFMIHSPGGPADTRTAGD